ncbi:hypothetical protein ACPCSG_23580 [Streptomyces cellulosae]
MPPLFPGSAKEQWCDACRAWTRLAGDILMLTPDGVSVVGTWTACEICDDPSEEAGRG